MEYFIGILALTSIVYFVASYLGGLAIFDLEKEIKDVNKRTIDRATIFERLQKLYFLLPRFESLLDTTSKVQRPVNKQAAQAISVCPKCGRRLVARRGRYGLFLACIGYPGCKFTQNVRS